MSIASVSIAAGLPMAVPSVSPFPVPSGAGILWLSLFCLALPGCGSQTGEARLISSCIQASPDNRARLAASLLTRAEARVEGDTVTVIAEVPVGISISGRLKFRQWRYRCRRSANGSLEFLDYSVEPMAFPRPLP